MRAWARGLGVETFVGTSGRVFPIDLKAAPLLRGWVEGRSLPAPEAETFMSRWQRRQQGKSGEHRL